MPQLNTLSFERMIEFVSIDLTPFGDQMRRFVNSTTYEGALPQNGHVTWQDEQWLAIPFESGGYQRGGDNLVKPAIQIADYSGALFNTFRELDYANGAEVIKYRAFADDVESDDDFASFLTERYVLNRPRKSQGVLELELATQIDFATIKFPSHTMQREEYPGLSSALLRE